MIVSLSSAAARGAVVGVALAIAALLVIIAAAILLSLKLGSVWQSSRLGSRYRYAITASS